MTAILTAIDAYRTARNLPNAIALADLFADSPAFSVTLRADYKASPLSAYALADAIMHRYGR